MNNNERTLQDNIDRRMLGERTVFLWGQVDDTSAKHVVERLMYLDMEAPGKEIKLIINSPGGYVTAGFSIYDTMMSISSPVSTICSGFAASMASILLSAGEKGRRFVLKHARVMIHQPSGGAGGPHADIEIQIKELLRAKELGAQILADNCGQPIEKIMKDFNRDYHMDAQEAVDYGIVDGIIERI
ncbi:ATP-dependent Clp protease proteolytic subunit [Flavipsychrobacter stenotrophus]|uniref:ATP-dependent Clp protease proteolytic subunit n=1 Tax=Flavipsychrobacter stenotrophus TaxID=2077091 RepID=A0A2S7SXZ7_9BACT|nr:ATP-dependent Clp protease proteolytic subunit [Flavipsychrobacter stenotrophus]PQJ11578.1 ATP-dependent Clp protease proteolytic subunit [Flavipsychrobacter stenotrophus]